MSVRTKPHISEWNVDENLILLRGWAKDGLTIVQIAKKVGIDRSTLYDWMTKDPNITDALKIGREHADFQVENALYKKALSGDTTAQIFWLKNRKPEQWREKKESEESTIVAQFVKGVLDLAGNNKND